MKNLISVEESIIKAVEELNETKVIRLASKALNAGMDPLFLLDLIKEGVKRVGKLYEDQKYFIADLIMAGLIFKEVLELEKMKLKFQRKSNEILGRVIVGTVKGDLHDIGKEIFEGLMKANGFEAIDLGVDVSKEVFTKSVIKYKPDIVALSGVLTSTIDSMKEIVDALVEAGVRNDVKIILGGSHLTKEACDYIGADFYTNDASEGVRLCKQMLGKI
ncbi:cobalamin B12-binding domain-containing protein [Thermosediminibacter oceani]|uniref:Cobalamin B12-binding domain protein n=1 Tax=Thermosediminibacter oceani (strain ATCC BAA-1034 / DSM 16646 / JW/IW-1228P) TaxID=555079 RepID=D9S2C9_THEOJ|nr:cobalamin-dependent protein [Thermosediminibacter oceani]ADL07556.1 cobalamin B12-binding domain protein [Thermosediminibacter oceani DSM 16646]